MRLTYLLMATIAALVAAAPAPTPDGAAAAALGATYSALEQAFCCDQKDCKYYDDGCAVSADCDCTGAGG
jgi:hypothetical protein